MIEPRSLALRGLVQRAIEEGLRDPGKVRGYGAETGSAPARSTPDGVRKGILSFATMRRIYERNDLVRAVADTKARQIVSLGWDVQRVNENHFAPMGLARQIKTLFERPNADGEDWTQMMLQVLRDVLVLDAGAIEKVRDASGAVVELVPRDGTTIIPIVDAHRRLKHYDQVTRSENGTEHRVKFDPADLIYIRFNPQTNSIWGLSPLETLAITVGADILAMGRNVSWLQDGNLADNILVMGRVGAAALENFQAFFRENSGNLSAMPMLSDLEDGGAGAKVLPLRQTNRDMQFLELDRWAFQRICAVYQVSPDDVIQLEATATKATAEAQQDASEGKGLAPEKKILEGALTAQVCAEFHGNLGFRFVELDKTNSLEEAQVHEIKARSGFTLNELRKEAGYPPLKGQQVDVDGVMVNVYDLPMNPATGHTLGLKGENPFEGLLGGDPGGGDFGDSEKSRRLATRAQGRRIPPHHDPHRRGLASYEAHRARALARAGRYLDGLGSEGVGAARSGVAAAIRDEVVR